MNEETSLVSLIDPSIAQGGGRVAMVRPDGEGVTIPIGRYYEALDKGYRPETWDEHEERRHEQIYGGRPFVAALEGLARGATFGLSDLIGAAIDPEHVREMKEHNKIASIVGEIPGTVGVLALTGVGPAVARAAGGGLLGSIAAGGVEGGMAGFGLGVSDVALSKDPLTAQAVAGVLFKHAMLGAAGGAALGGVGYYVGRAAHHVRVKLEGVATGLEQRAATAETMLERAQLEAARDAELARVTGEMNATRPTLIEDLRALRPDMKAIRTQIPSLALDEARKNALIQAERSLAGGMRKWAEDPTAALKTIQNYRSALEAAAGMAPPPPVAGMLERVSGIQGRLQALAQGPHSPVLDDIAGRLAELPPLAGPEPITLRRGLQLENGAKGATAPTDEAVAALKKIQRPDRLYRGMTDTEFEATVAQGKGVHSTGAWSLPHEGTNFADDIAIAEGYANYSFGRTNPLLTGKPNYLVEVKRSGSLTKALDSWRTAGRDVGLPQDQITRAWRMDPVIDPANFEASRVVMRQILPAPLPAPAPPGLGEEVLGKIAGKLGRQATSAAAYAGASAVGGALGIPGAGLIAHFVANEIGGHVGRLLSTHIRARAAEIGARILHATARLVSGTATVIERAALVHAGGMTPDAFDAVRDSVFEAAANPRVFQARLEPLLDGLRAQDPELARGVRDLNLLTAAHLAEVAPRALGSPTLADQSGAVSELERLRFMRRVEVAVDPGKLLDHIEDGTLTPSMVQTADAIYGAPGGIMALLRERLLEALGGKKPPYVNRLIISMLLGAPATASLRPANVAAMQGRMSQELHAAANPPEPRGQNMREDLTPGQRASTRGGF